MNLKISTVGNPDKQRYICSTRERPIKNILPMTRSSHAIINEFGIKFVLKKMERRDTRGWKGERRFLLAVPTEPWLCSQLLLAELSPLSSLSSATLRILLYLPVCYHPPSSTLPPLHPPRDVRLGDWRGSQIHRIYFIKPFSELPPHTENSILI